MYVPSRFLAVGLSACALVWAALPLQAQSFVSHTHAGARLHIPSGWTVETDPHGALHLGDLMSDAVLQLRIHPYQPGVDAGDLLARVNMRPEAMTTLASARSENGEGRLVVYRARTDASALAVVVVDPDAARDVLTLAALTTTAEHLDRLGGVEFVTTVTNSVTRTNSTGRPLPEGAPRSGHEELSPGARLLVAQYLQDLNLTTGAGGWRIRYLTLLPDGTCYTGVPPRPVEALTREILLADERERVCTWVQRGSALHLHHAALAGTDYERSRLVREGDGWRRNRTQHYRPAQPLTARQLRGHFRSERARTVGTYTGNPLAMAAASASYWFHPDGSFERSLAAGASVRGASGGGSSAGQRRASGTYHLDGTTLTLRHGDGTVVQATALAWPGSDAIVLGGARYERAD